MWIPAMFVGANGEMINGAVEHGFVEDTLNSPYAGSPFQMFIDENDIPKVRSMFLVAILIDVGFFADETMLPAPLKGGTWQLN